MPCKHVNTLQLPNAWLTLTPPACKGITIVEFNDQKNDALTALVYWQRMYCVCLDLLIPPIAPGSLVTSLVLTVGGRAPLLALLDISHKSTTIGAG